MSWTLTNCSNPQDLVANGELAIMRKYLPHAQYIIDGGARTGEWTRAALDHNSTARYVLFDPHPNAKLSGIPYSSISYSPKALAGKSGPREFFVAEVSCGLSSLYQRSVIGGATRITVPATSIDDYLVDVVPPAKEIFLKLDVEGGEFDALCGARKAFDERKILAAQFEYGGTWSDAHVQLKMAWDFYQSLPRYSFSLADGSEIREMKAWDDSAEHYQWSTWLIARKE